MRRALQLAQRGWGRTAPNPMVGAVLVKGAQIIGEGFHPEFGREHAEIAALRAAGDKARGATMYVTLEPCNHDGKSGPCAQAIVDAGVQRVIFAVSDPNPEAAGGAARLRRAGVQLAVGLEADGARELNAAFFHRYSSNRPFVTLKLAMSIDGAIADHARSADWLTSEKSRKRVHKMRAGVDAVAVGLGTALADDPALTVRGRISSRVPPVRIVFSRSAAFPTTLNLAVTASEIPTWLLTTSEDTAAVAALESLGVRVLKMVDLADGMRKLFASGIHSLLVEGGAQLASSLLDSELVDRLVVFRAPLVLGSGGLIAFASARPRLVSTTARLKVLHSEMLDGDSMTTYAVSGA
jgi:diaminohydroxyphosphoribosylaminopyrimidine deaminase/5-amino-6-(5-phosphoribosylamino)uracil reductase